MNYHPLPAINIFPQFNRQLSVLSPLDLSLRTSAIPITPPSTPSPPRKQPKTSDESAHLWRPHSLAYFNSNYRTEQTWNSENTKKSTENEDTNKSTAAECVKSNRFDLEEEDETIVLTEDEDEGSQESSDEEFVDVLSNDDDFHPLATVPASADNENDKEEALSANQMVYTDTKLHKRALDGFAKLFDMDFRQNQKSYIDLGSPSDLSNAELEPCKQSLKNKSEKKRLKIRKQLTFDEDNTSPVSGTIIRKLRDDEELVIRKGDIDPAFNVVEITEEAKANIALIDNKIGAYLCQLCRTVYDDAFKLAQHRCPRIVHIEYRCSECDKVFNCPANLASHRRWHKPKPDAQGNQNKKLPSDIDRSSKQIENDEGSAEGIFTCKECGKSFRRQAYLKKHVSSHQMMNQLKSMEPLKHHHSGITFPPSQSNPYSMYTQSHQMAPRHKIYANGIRFSPFFPHFDQRRFPAIEELYLHHHFDRHSAFHYVPNQSFRSLPNSHGASIMQTVK